MSISTFQIYKNGRNFNVAQYDFITWNSKFKIKIVKTSVKLEAKSINIIEEVLFL